MVIIQCPLQTLPIRIITFRLCDGAGQYHVELRIYIYCISIAGDGLLRLEWPRFGSNAVGVSGVGVRVSAYGVGGWRWG